MKRAVPPIKEISEDALECKDASSLRADGTASSTALTQPYHRVRVVRLAPREEGVRGHARARW